MRSLIALLSPIALFVVLESSAASQQGTSAPPDPKQLMLEAAKINGLTGADVTPWHLKSTFQVLDQNGKITDSGTYEEFWVASTKYRRTIATSTFAQTDYGTDKGVLRSGRREQPPALIIDIRREFVDPILNQQAIAQQSFGLSTQELNDEKLNCLRIVDLPVDPGRGWCVQEGKPLLRKSTSTGESLQVIHGQFVLFGGHFIAGDLQFLQSGRLSLTAHLDSIEPLDPSVNLDPSADAVLLHRRINVSAGVAVGMLKKHDPPEYPADVNVSGRVTLLAIIGVDGRVEELRVISGHPMLRQAALDAVRKWTYRPFLLNNEPVEVMTQINVDFKR